MTPIRLIAMDSLLLRKLGRTSIAAMFAVGAFAFSTISAHAGGAGLNTYDVTGTFEDGGTLGGYFEYDPTTSTFGAYDVFTTATTNTSILDSYSGTTNDPFAGFIYDSADSTASGTGDSDHIAFDTTSGGLGLPGELSVLPTAPGVDDNLAYAGGASEFNSTGSRTLTSGFLSLAAAPEVSSGAIMAVLLVLAAPLMALARKRTQNRA